MKKVFVRPELVPEATLAKITQVALPSNF